MPKQTTQPTQQQLASSFHDSAAFNCEWPRELREVHQAARDAYSAYLSFDWLEMQARRDFNQLEGHGAYIPVYQSFAAAAYEMVQRIDAHGAQLVADWEAEKAANTAAEGGDTFYCEHCGKTLPEDEIAMTVRGTSAARYVCDSCVAALP